PAPFGAEVPLAREKRGVTSVLERLGESHLTQREFGAVRRREQFCVAIPFLRLGRADVISDAAPLRIFAREQAGSRGGTDRARGVGIAEPRAFTSEAVKMRRFVEGAAVATEVALAEIIGNEENNVRSLRGDERPTGGEQEE